MYVCFVLYHSSKENEENHETPIQISHPRIRLKCCPAYIMERVFLQELTGARCSL
jgi:hypothetical protein